MLSTSRNSLKSGNFFAKFLCPSDKMFPNLHGDLSNSLQSSIARGDWIRTGEIIKKGGDFIHGEVKKSQIRGRGGAGFAAGTKWGFLPKDGDEPRYLVVNGDEGEPGTCKDRQILTNEPHKLIEGAMLASCAIKAHKAYIYIRGEFRHETSCLRRAIEEARAARLIGKNNKFGYDFDMEIHSGAGSYVCGQETGLLNSLEGKRGRPRTVPPYPAAKGLWRCPTIVNNVETIASVPEICKRGGDWFASIGVEGSRGTKIYCISGAVNNPCVVEEAMGIPIKDLIERYAGGVVGGWDNLLCVIPGGLSAPAISRQEAETTIMGYNELQKLGSALGTGAIIVIPKDADIVEVYKRLAFFYEHESCGQCKICREGTLKIYKILDKFSTNQATKADLAELEKLSVDVKDGICALAQAASDPIKGLLRLLKPKLESLAR